jgi:hypothetical protein
MATTIESGLASSTSGADSFIQNDLITTGAVIWVDSVNGSDSNSGLEQKPLATLGQAITNATANNGDIIVIKSGHTQTLTSSITVNKAGLKIFGIGSGSSAPQFTVNAAIDGINITANNVEINNLYFPAGTTATNTARINIDAASVLIKACTFLCGAYDSDTITITSNGLYAKVESCSFTVTALGPVRGISIESASAAGIWMKSLSFNGGTNLNWSTAAISSTVAHLNYKYDTITLTNYAGISHSGNAKGLMSNIIAGTGSPVSA